MIARCSLFTIFRKGGQESLKRIINVPTIRDDNSGYEQILSIASEITNAPKKHFDFDFSHCSKLEHNGVVILGALARFVDYQNTRTNRTI